MTSAWHDFNIHPATRIGYVSLNISDIDRSLSFYEKVLGFKKVDRPSNERALLSDVDGHTSSYLVELLQAKEAAGYYKASMSETTRRAGLYHFAILLPERKYLADMLQNLSERRGEIRFDGLADHPVSESMYIRDPDNIGIEIYCDKPSLQWEWSGSRVRMVTDLLNTEDLLRESSLGVESDACQDSHRPCPPPCSKPCKGYEVLSRDPWAELYGDLSWRLLFCCR